MAEAPPPEKLQPPPSPLFDRAPRPRPPIDQAEIDRLRKEMPSLIRRLKGGRGERFYPYLLVRSFAGDNGTRPIAAGQTHSCDVWVARGDPVNAPAIPPVQWDPDTDVPRPHTTYTNVWNIGHAPVGGAKVEFYVQNITEGTPRQLINTARVDLASRLSPAACHKLVKCPTAFIVTMNWQALYVRVSAIGDNLNGPDSFDPMTDRHVARADIEPF